MEAANRPAAATGATTMVGLLAPQALHILEDTSLTNVQREHAQLEDELGGLLLGGGCARAALEEDAFVLEEAAFALLDCFRHS